jgi:hypothetical protein
MAAGAVIVIDCCLRLRFAEEFYASTGVAPRQLFLNAFVSLSVPSLHLANDAYLYQVTLLLLQIGLGFCLALGYRTRLVTALSWYLLVSLQARNPVILNSGDSLLAALMFWAMFLPWNRVWSMDARDLPSNVATSVCSAATVGVTMQMVCMYLFAALHKTHPYWTEQGTAIYLSLSLGHHATGAAALLLPYESALRTLTRMVVLTELLLAFAIFAPWPRVRTGFLMLAAVMHLTFGFFLEIGIFRYSPLIGLLALLPLGRLRGDNTTSFEMAPWYTAVPLLGACLLTWAVNLESLGKGREVFLPPPLLALAPAVIGPQHWAVFAGPGLELSGWFAVEIETAETKAYHALTGEEIGTKKPVLVSATYPDDRWRKFMMNLAGMPAGDPFRQNFADWCLRRWNIEHPQKPARSVRVWQVVEETSIGGAATAPRWNLLAQADDD